MSRCRRYIGLMFAVCCFLAGNAQQAFRVMQYNVENLFDCRHDSLKQDTEFLPEAVRGWSWNRYHDKINKVAKVILAASGEQVPDLVGLCEVENAYCLDGLVRYSPLRDATYRYVMTDSPDERGIDVALLYQPATFRLIGVRSIRVSSQEAKRRPTRDLLHVSGRVVSGDTLDVFVCHFPSRSGGTRETEPYRMWVASCLRHATDSLMAVRRNPYLIIMGDFNDVPSSRSLRQVLGVCPSTVEAISPTGFYSLLEGKQGGTYRYKGEWSFFDHLIVNGNLLSPNSSLTTSPEKACVLAFPFLLEEDEQYGGDTPFRTYKGMRYHGGYSDHLPVCFDMEIRLP